MAAGLGFKTFTTGEVLTAADVNGYLMQGILVFATEAARNSAITSPQEGQFAFTKDNNSLWYYTGSAWVASSASGDIEGVTAGVGISGGGTSGTVTITNSMATAIDAKGDLVAGTGADTFARLAVGANNTVLTADSSTSTGLKWATTSSGAVIAVQQAFKSSTFTTTSTSLTDITGLSVTYTPTSASNKILLIAHIFGMGTIGSSGIGFAFSRGGTAIGIGDASGSLSRVTGATQAADSNNGVISAMMYLDSPATTSSTTWSVQCRVDAGTAYVNRTATDGYWRGTSSLTIMEVTP